LFQATPLFPGSFFRSLRSHGFSSLYVGFEHTVKSFVSPNLLARFGVRPSTPFRPDRLGPGG
jgi:hypothetical protein